MVISELAQPLAVRRAVSFSEAIYERIHTIEGITARRVNYDGIDPSLDSGEIPVIVDPDAGILTAEPGRWSVVIDARMLKRAPAPLPISVPLLIGLGPGFHARENCDAVIETRRGHTLGRLFWEGQPLPDSGLPEGDPRRVLRASQAGEVWARANIGDHVESGQPVAEIQAGDRPPVSVITNISGVLRGMIHDGITVPNNAKIGDVDPRDDASACFLVSDKALAVAGGVLEAVFSSSMAGIVDRQPAPR
jgi:xanthine dehydrogenase accessory factor